MVACVTTITAALDAAAMEATKRINKLKYK